MSDQDETVHKPDFVRQGREADLTEVSLEKLIEAGKRGIQVDLTDSKPGRVTAKVNKVIVKSDDND